MKNKTPKNYIVKRTIVLEYETTALNKKELLEIPRGLYDTLVYSRKIEKGLQVRRKISNA